MKMKSDLFTKTKTNSIKNDCLSINAHHCWYSPTACFVAHYSQTVARLSLTSSICKIRPMLISVYIAISLIKWEENQILFILFCYFLKCPSLKRNHLITKMPSFILKDHKNTILFINSYHPLLLLMTCLLFTLFVQSWVPFILFYILPHMIYFLL